MKSALAVALIMLYAVLPVRAAADSTDDAYLRALHTYGLSDPVRGDAALVDIGHQMCAYLAAGHTDEQLYQYVLPGATHIGPADVWFLIATARQYYCPAAVTV